VPGADGNSRCLFVKTAVLSLGPPIAIAAILSVSS
jgi:hypothetical protein